MSHCWGDWCLVCLWWWLCFWVCWVEQTSWSRCWFIFGWGWGWLWINLRLLLFGWWFVWFSLWCFFCDLLLGCKGLWVVFVRVSFIVFWISCCRIINVGVQLILLIRGGIRVCWLWLWCWCGCFISWSGVSWIGSSCLGCDFWVFVRFDMCFLCWRCWVRWWFRNIMWGCCICWFVGKSSGWIYVERFECLLIFLWWTDWS